MNTTKDNQLTVDLLLLLWINMEGQLEWFSSITASESNDPMTPDPHLRMLFSELNFVVSYFIILIII